MPTLILVLNKIFNLLIAIIAMFLLPLPLQAQKDSINIPENESVVYDIVKKKIQHNNCEGIPPPPAYKTIVYLQNKKIANPTEVVIQKNNKWGIWNIDQNKFIFEAQYDSIVTINMVVKEHEPPYNHFFVVLDNKKWYFLDSAFQKMNTMGYDSIECDLAKVANNLIFYNNGKINLYNPFENKIAYLEADSFLYVKKNYPFNSGYIFYYKNRNIKFINIEKFISNKSYNKIFYWEYSQYFLLKNHNMDFLSFAYKNILPNLQKKVWNIQQWEDKFYSFRGVYTYRLFCDDNFHLMFLTKDNKYIFFQKKGEVFTLKVVPFISILEPIYLLFLSPYYQKIE